MARDIVSSMQAPQAVGPYSQAVKANGFLFVSGQLPIVPGSGELLSGPIGEQTRQVMENLRSILKEAGLSLSDVVKATILLRDLKDFDEVNAVYAEFFPSESPARVCFEVARLPKDADIEIECIAVETTV
jgi:2-iminobutanoate/2-iminopropanoate deaminase